MKVRLSSALACTSDGSMVFAWPTELTCFYDNMLLEKIQTQKGSNERLFNTDTHYESFDSEL